MKEVLHYETSQYAKSTFNADTIISYPLTVWKKYKKKYGHCHVMVVQKNGSCPIRLYFLYNNEAKKNLNKYIKSMEGVFWYLNLEEFIEVIEPEQDSVLHIKMSPQKRRRLKRSVTA